MIIVAKNPDGTERVIDPGDTSPAPQPPSKGVQRGEDGRLFLGSAVENGKIRFLSVSAIQMFDVESEGGCPRKWGYRYPGKIREEKKTASKEKGDKSAKLLEHYLTTGEMNLPPMLAVGVKYLPKPGPDLEVERMFSGSDENLAKVLALRDAFLKTGVRTFNDDAVRIAGLSAGGIPLIGAADYRHRRGEYLTPDGILCKERSEHGRVTETGDHKTIGMLDDRMQGNVVVMASYAKKSHELPENVQLLGYGKHENNLHPETDHHRFSLNYYQSKGANKARKVTVLVSAREVNERWGRIDEIVAPEMERVASATTMEDLPTNANACDAFNFVTVEGIYRKGCMHQDYCTVNRTQIVIHRLGIPEKKTQGDAMSLFTMLAKPTAVEDVMVAPAPPAPPVDPVVYAAAVEAEKAKQRAEDAAPKAPVVARISCGAPGCGVDCAPGWVVVIDQGPSTFEICAGCKGAGGLGVLPPDAPVATDLLQTAAALPAAAVAEITDPVFRAKVEEHARQHAEKDAVEEQAAAVEKGAVWCSGGSATAEPVRVDVDMDSAVARKMKCVACDKVFSFKQPEKDEATGVRYILVKRHKPVGVKMSAPPSPPPPPPPAPTLHEFLTAPLPGAVAPAPPPPAIVPPPPSYVAPDALPGQTAMPSVVPPPPPLASAWPVYGGNGVAPPPPSVIKDMCSADIGLSRHDLQQAVKLLSAAEDAWSVDPSIAEPLVKRAVEMATAAIARL